MKYEKNLSIRRIFILRPDNLGDLILFSGSLKEIRLHWPHAQITLCINPAGMIFFRDCPYVDKLISYEALSAEGRLYWMPKIRGSDRLGSWLRKKIPALAYWPLRFDLALLPLVSPKPKHHEIMSMIPSTQKISIFGKTDNQTPACRDMTKSYYTLQMDASNLPIGYSEISLNKSFLEFIGINVTAEENWPVFWTSNKDTEWAQKKIQKCKGSIVLGIAPGKSSNPKHNLPTEWWQEVLQNISHKKIHVILLGSSQDRLLCTEIELNLKKSSVVDRITNLCGITTIGQMIECVRCCDILLSQDTAALHMAVALKKPAGGIVAGGHLGRFYPWGDPQKSRVINHPMDCYGCGMDCKYETLKCVQDIPPSLAVIVINELTEIVK